MTNNNSAYHLFSCIRGTLREQESNADVGGTDVELWFVIRHERRVTTTFILSQDLIGSVKTSIENIVP